MKKCWLFIVSIVALAFLAQVADAGKVSIKGTHSANEIRGTCDRVDGVFTEGGGTYGCSKLCGGQVCSVTCVGGKCTGDCPSCGRRERRLRVLGGADAVNHTLNNLQRR